MSKDRPPLAFLGPPWRVSGNNPQGFAMWVAAGFPPGRSIRRRKPMAQWNRHLEHMASWFSCGCCWGRATRLPACGSGASRGRFLCFHRTTKSQLQTPSWAAPQMAVETVVYKFRTNSRSHELWRETAQERPDRPQGSNRKSGALGESAAVIGLLRGRPEPERLFAWGLMAEDWKPGSNVLRNLPKCRPAR